MQPQPSVPQVVLLPDTRLGVTLQAQEWNMVLETLFDGRYRVVAPLIQKIQEQLMAQGQAQAAAAQAQAANGLDRDPSAPHS